MKSFEELGAMLNITPEKTDSVIRLQYCKERNLDDYIRDLEPGVYIVTGDEYFEDGLIRRDYDGFIEHDPTYIQNIIVKRLKYDFSAADVYGGLEYNKGTENIGNICAFYGIEMPDLRTVSKEYPIGKCIDDKNPELVREFKVEHAPTGVRGFSEIIIIQNGLSGNTWRWNFMKNMTVKISFKHNRHLSLKFSVVTKGE